MACTALPLECWLRERLSQFCQLSGHQGSLVPATDLTLWKKTGCRECAEAVAYRAIMADPAVCQLVPRFSQEVEYKGDSFIEIEDLTRHFTNPAIMDIKMGKRTFLESEVSNKGLRQDLYLKMIKIDLNEPTQDEHEQQAVTKLRYMQFREKQSSTHSYGFRIDAIKQLPSRPCRKNYQKVRSKDQIIRVLSEFILGNPGIRKAFIDRLKIIRSCIEQSHFFRSHEVVGSSLLFMYDDVHCGVWLIDFAKVSAVNEQLLMTHRDNWTLGNHEDGYLTGLDNLIQMFEDGKYAQSLAE